jgi:PAS domain-containing protein
MIFFSKSHGRSQEEFLRKMDFSRLLLENMEAGVVACDENGKLVLLNRVAREWHGLDKSDVSQSEWAGLYDLFEPDGVTPMTVDRIPLVRAFRGEEV